MLNNIIANECRKLLNDANSSEYITSALPYGMDERMEIIENLLTSISGF